MQDIRKGLDELHEEAQLRADLPSESTSEPRRGRRLLPWKKRSKADRPTGRLLQLRLDRWLRCLNESGNVAQSSKLFMHRALP